MRHVLLGNSGNSCRGQLEKEGAFHRNRRDAILRVDAKIEKVLAAVKQRKTYEQEDWLVIVTADHGGKGTGHSGGHTEPEILNSFLIVSGSSAQRGEFKEQTYIVDAPVTALTHLGIDINPDWKLDGRPVGLK